MIDNPMTVANDAIAKHFPDDPANAVRAQSAVVDVMRHYGMLTPSEPLVRYCPGCGSIGPVEAQYRDCCPDGDEARLIPQALAEKCRDTFQVAIKAMMADAAANDSARESVEKRDPVAAAREHIIGELHRQDDSAWQSLFSKVAATLKCLPSAFVTGNEHVIQAAKSAMANASDAARWREVARRFDNSKTSESERVLDGLGLNQGDASKSLGSIIDHALSASHANEPGGAS